MRILFLDIASHDGLVALCTEEAVAAYKRIDHRIQDDELVTCFEQVLKKAKWKPTNLTHIACIIGPGGFTSLRVGAAFANALSWSLRIPVAGVHLSDLYTARVHPLSLALPRRGREHSFLWLHSTKKNEVFVRGGRWKNPTHVGIGDIPDDIHWIGELLPEHRRESWGEMPLKKIEDILPEFLAKQAYSTEILKPWYGRDG